MTSEFNPIVAAKRRERDITKLIMTNHKLERCPDNPSEFTIDFVGPSETLYEGGTWELRVYLPDSYPFKSPSLGFVNKLFHPNVDLKSGTICLDVINQTWSPMYELVNIFDVFLPQLLSYPNASDPLNIEAANLLLKNEESYKEKVKEYVRRYAMKDKNTNHNLFLESKLKMGNDLKDCCQYSNVKLDRVCKHKVSTDLELSDELIIEEKEEKMSHMSQLSDLSDTSGIMNEECIEEI